jgi:hypothetical protein
VGDHAHVAGVKEEARPIGIGCALRRGLSRAVFANADRKLAAQEFF